MNMIKRLGIFCFYDLEGIVDDYVIRLLDGITTNLDRLIIVVNGEINDDSKKKLSKFTSEIIVRENQGFDAEAYKDVFIKYLKFQGLENFDELVLFNDTFFGPLYPFSNMFSDMEESLADFWGITVHGEIQEEDIAEHLQSYFLVIRKQMFLSSDFAKYWYTLKPIKNIRSAIIDNEARFTRYFYQKGFDYAAYCDTRELDRPHRSAINHYIWNQNQIIEEYKCPIIKKKALIFPKRDMLRISLGIEANKSLEYIKKHTEYDVSLIYKHILRKYNITDIHGSLNLDYILPKEYLMTKQRTQRYENVAIIAHLFFEDLFDKNISYLKNAVNIADIYVTTNSDDKKELILQKYSGIMGDRFHVIVVNARGRDLAALLVACTEITSKYEYVCFIHDKKSSQNSSVAVGKAFAAILWENMLVSKEYVQNIIETLESNKELGLLVPPRPHHGEYRCMIDENYWSGDYQLTKQLAKMLGLKVNIDENKATLAIGSAFWCKTAALKSIFQYPWKLEDFPVEPMPIDATINHAIERIFPYVAQQNGYLTAVVMNDQFAGAELGLFRELYKQSSGLDKQNHYSMDINIMMEQLAKSKRKKRRYKRCFIATLTIFVLTLLLMYVHLS